MSPARKGSLVSILVERKKMELKKRGKAFKRKVLRKPRSFKGLERTYFTKIKPIVASAKSVVDRILIPKIDLFIRQREAIRPKSDKKDSWVDDISSAMGQVRVEFERLVPVNTVINLASGQASTINRANSQDFDKSFQSVMGLIPIKLEPWLKEEMKHFTKENVKLIKSIPDNYFFQVETIVSRMIQQGKMTDDITEEIYKRYDVSLSRAALIARDQTNKFNGSLTQLRQQEVGITQYQWSTSDDERVRPEHAEREGKDFYWNDPPEDGAPGQAINCRCVALGIIEGVEE